MSSETWTIDSIAHALPHPELRQSFLRQAHLAPVDQLQGVIDKWVCFVEKIEAERPRIERLRDYVRENGQLPPHYEASLVDVNIEDLKAQTGRARGAA